MLDAVSPVECSGYINRLQNMCYCFFVFVFSGLAFRNCEYNLSCGLIEKQKEKKKKKACGIMTLGMNNVEIDTSLSSALM